MKQLHNALDNIHTLIAEFEYDDNPEYTKAYLTTKVLQRKLQRKDPKYKPEFVDKTTGQEAMEIIEYCKSIGIRISDTNHLKVFAEKLGNHNI